MSIVAVSCLAVVVYTYVGYPLLIHLLGSMRRFSAAAPGGSKDERSMPRVSVLCPIWRGERWIDDKLASLVAQDYPPERLEILLGLDGSDDQTLAIASRWASRDARIMLHPARRRAGKPATLNRLAAAAGGEILVLTDVRPRLGEGAVRALVDALADPRVGCATGELQVPGPNVHARYWRYEQAIRRAESRFRGMVGANGPLLALRRGDMMSLDEGLVSDDLALALELARRRLRTTLVPGARASDLAFSDAGEQVRKVRNLGGNWQLFTRRPWLLVPLLNPIWFETLSHKVLRLVVPFALVLLALESARVLLDGADPDELTVAATQLAAYALAGLRLGAPGRLARAFVMAQVAVVAGLWRFATGRVSVLW